VHQLWKTATKNRTVMMVDWFSQCTKHSKEPITVEFEQDYCTTPLSSCTVSSTTSIKAINDWQNKDDRMGGDRHWADLVEMKAPDKVYRNK